MPVIVRPARPDDLAAAAAIYSENIRARTATFETREHTGPDLAGWLEHPLPFLVAEAPGENRRPAVLGWIRASAYSPRDCYRGIGDYSVHVAERARGRRIGDQLMAGFIDACSGLGMWKILGRIFPENTPSRALAARHGFREVGRFVQHAKLEGRWRDVLIVERLLVENLD